MKRKRFIGLNIILLLAVSLSFPNSIFGYKSGICLPVFPALQQQQVKYVCDTISEFQKRHGAK